MAAATETPKIKLYTNHNCPWAQRAHIALNELQIPYTEEIIDLSTPRTPEYLSINPRGLVPSLSYDGQILTESAVVATFLADAFPDAAPLLPKSTDPKGALTRARIQWFVDAFFSKVQVHVMKSYAAADEAAREKAVGDAVDAVVKELEPVLKDAGPFFGGAERLTLAEVLTGSFVIRLYTFPKHGLAPATLLTELAARAPNFDKWARAVIAHPSVAGVYDEEAVIPIMRQRFAKDRAPPK